MESRWQRFVIERTDHPLPPCTLRKHLYSMREMMEIWDFFFLLYFFHHFGKLLWGRIRMRVLLREYYRIYKTKYRLKWEIIIDNWNIYKESKWRIRRKGNSNKLIVTYDVIWSIKRLYGSIKKCPGKEARDENIISITIKLYDSAYGHNILLLRFQ